MLFCSGNKKLSYIRYPEICFYEYAKVDTYSIDPFRLANNYKSADKYKDISFGPNDTRHQVITRLEFEIILGPNVHSLRNAFSSFYLLEYVNIRSTKNITDKGIDLSEINYVTKEFHAKNKKSQIFSNDLLIARHGNSGSAFLIPETVSEAQALNVVIIKNSKNFDSYFMENYFETTKIKKYMASLKAGSVQGVVNTKDIEKISINLPSFNEQNKINSFLQLFDRKIQLLENQSQICLDFKIY